MRDPFVYERLKAMTNWSANIHQLRRNNGLSLDSLADRIGRGASELQAVEAGAKEPDVALVVQLARVFSVSTDAILLSRDEDRYAPFCRKDLQFLVLDVDGVLTDGGMYYTEQGDEFKKFNVKDGRALKKLKQRQIPVGIISSGFNQQIIQRRADLFAITYVDVGTENKLGTLDRWCEDLAIERDRVAFIGDDINDTEVMKAVGVGACPADAVSEVFPEADLILTKKGGDGCVREFVDEVMLR